MAEWDGQGAVQLPGQLAYTCSAARGVVSIDTVGMAAVPLRRLGQQQVSTRGRALNPSQASQCSQGSQQAELWTLSYAQYTSIATACGS